jgi:hypothetical protein
MKDPETVQKFIELRAQGWGFVRIAEQCPLSMSLPPAYRFHTDFHTDFGPVFHEGKSEIRNPRTERNPNSEFRKTLREGGRFAFRFSDFGLP